MLIGLQPGFEGKERPEAVSAASSVNRGWDLIWPSLMAQTIKNPPANAGDVRDKGLTPGEGNGNPLQYSCLGNPMDREAWWATVQLVTKESDVT